MKKILKLIKQFFLKIWLFIDKLIVIPITKGFLKLNEKFGNSSKFFESWLSKTNTILFVSLFLAVGVFIVIDQKILVFSENSAEVLKNQPVTAVYNQEAYVVEGLPKHVDITLIGSKADLYIAKQSPAREVIVDLSDLKAGNHKVNIKYNQASANIDYKVNPSVATIIIYPKMSETKTLTFDVLNQDKLDSKLIINKIKVASDKVVIKGAEYKLKQVATVKALVDINNLVSQEVGTHTLKDVVLKAYDEAGNVVDVEIVPNKIDAEIKISSPSKILPIKVVPVGEVAFGQAISAIEMSESKVTVYGTEEALAGLEFIEVEVNVAGLKEGRQYKVELVKPVGVKLLSVNTINVSVSLDKVVERDVENVSIDVRGLGDNYIVQGLSANDIKVTVNIKGVSVVLGQIKPEDIVAYIDLKGYGEGEHEVEVKVEGTDVKVHYLAKTKKVKIRIISK